MANQEIELFDLCSKDQNVCWSLNSWKTRIVLNLKKIPYRTTWLEYPDAAPTLKGVGLPPNDSSPAYTIPAIKLPDGKYVMDSRKIISDLEALSSSPNLHVDSPVLAEVEALIPKAVMGPLRPLIMPKIPRNVLNPISAQYFEETRAKRFGCSLTELEAKTPPDKCWKEAEPGLKEMGDLLKKQGGPFFLGDTVSYADLVVVGMLQFLKRIEADLYESLVNKEPSLKRLYEASYAWLERDSY